MRKPTRYFYFELCSVQCRSTKCQCRRRREMLSKEDGRMNTSFQAHPARSLLRCDAGGSNDRVFTFMEDARFLLPQMDRLFRPESSAYTRLVFLMVAFGRLCNDVPCRTAVVQGFWPGSAGPAPPTVPLTISTPLHEMSQLLQYNILNYGRGGCCSCSGRRARCATSV